jgi:branched-chain amino acid transport system substrate-binding protein
MKSSIKILIGLVVLLVIVELILISVKFTGKTIGGELNKEVIKIGFTGPLTGEVSAFGEGERQGIDLAIQELNKEGGLDGRKVEIIYEDSQCQPNLAASNVQKLISTGIEVIIGDTCSSATLAAAPIAEKNKVVLITPISGADSISNSGDYIFRNFIPNSYYSKAGAEKISRMGIEKVAVMYINNDAGLSWKNTFIESFNGKITNIESYAPQEKDFKTSLLKIKESNPELVFLAGYYSDGALVLKQAKELGLNQQFFGAGDAFDDPAFIEAAGESAEGFMYLSVPAGFGGKFTEFKQKFEKKYKEEPSLFATYAYDTTIIVLEAIKKCGLDSEEIKNCLYKTDYYGITNHITFDKNGDLVGGETIIKVIKNGKAIEFSG